jgi:hypothetical protein
LVTGVRGLQSGFSKLALESFLIVEDEGEEKKKNDNPEGRKERVKCR